MLYQVDANYMKKQPEINEKMRAILIDWLIQVHLRFGLLAETLYLTVTIIDRYLSVRERGGHCRKGSYHTLVDSCSQEE